MDFLNFYVTVIAWMAFNAIKFSIIKDKLDDEGKHFPIRQYIEKTWDNWLASALCVPLLLWIGYRQLDIITNPVAEHTSTLKWNDIYYLFSGVISEIVIDVYKGWRKTKA